MQPLVRTAVYADSGEFTRAADHKRAAGLLHDDGIPADELVPHLLAAEPESDPWVVQTLRDAAASAMARGAPEVAAPCLRRAPAGQDGVRVDIALELGTLMIHTGRGAQARAAHELARTAVHDDDLENSAKLTAVFAAAALASFEPPANWIARLDATALAGRATEELVAAGGRPRGARLTGPESLTASELRVARLAAGGATNREVAQALFVSLRTVEFHLTHAYRKLGFATRQKLASALRQAG